MDVRVIPKLVGSIFTQHSVPCHVVAMGQVARDIFPGFDDLYGNQHHYNSLEWRDKAAMISRTETFTVRGHAIVSVVPFVIDLTNEDGIVVLHSTLDVIHKYECDSAVLSSHSGHQPLS